MPTLLQTRLSDGGPVYAETDLSQIVAEPFNAASAFLFMIVAIYWLYRVMKEGTKNTYLKPSLIILLIGGIGGTIYHAFRAHRIFLLMDWVPILILCMIASVYLIKIMKVKWYWPIVAVLGLFILEWINFYIFPPQIGVNVSYILLASIVISPLIIYLIKTEFKYGFFVAGAIVAFAFAITFRALDKSIDLPMGTHFLWHSFGAITAHLFLAYLFRLPLHLKKGAEAP